MRHGASRTLTIAASLTALAWGVPSFAGPIETMPAGTWYEAPNTNMSAVLPNPIPPGYSGPQAVMGAWSGGAYDTNRERLVVWGGGHGDYGGNEIYAFDINTFQWSRPWGPSANIPQPGQSCTNTYSDGNPVSRHTYDGLEYVPSIDRFWANGGSRYCGSGGFGWDTWTFNFTANAWERKADRPDAYGAIPLTAYDPVNDRVLFQSYFDLLSWDPVANVWTKRGEFAPGLGGELGAAYDWRRKKMVLMGTGVFRIYDLSGTGLVTPISISTTGDNSIVGARYPGVVYDPDSDKIVAWAGGSDVYVLDMDTLRWTRYRPTSGAQVTGANGGGTYGRFRYIPSKRVFIVVNHIDENVYFYKPSFGGTQPADTTSPAAVSDVRPR